jgi:uncharacterized protein YdhG (YjbR/CyaY superfamily)
MYCDDMPTSSGSRSDHFPAIEKKHGKPINHWLSMLKTMKGAKYEEQMALLRDTHGFSRTHANAVVMQFRGSTTSKRFATPAEYFAAQDPKKSATMKKIFAAITEKYPDLELVVAWNQPMLRVGSFTVFGASAAANHLTLNPFSKDALDTCARKLQAYNVNKNTFTVPADWKIDAALLRSLVKVRLAER